MNKYDCVMKNSVTEMSDDGTHNVEKECFIEVSAEDFQIVELEQREEGVFARAVLQVRYSGPGPWSASLDVEYSFSPSGSTFFCSAKRYRAGNNGRTKGNVFIDFGSAEAWGVRELTNDDAIQDGQWHDLQKGGGSVGGNRNTAFVFFKYIFDQPGIGDSSASVRVEIPFSLVAPTIDNPQLVKTPRPTLTGTGAPGATVKLYQQDVGDIVFATVEKVPNNGYWTTTLTEPLWMANPFRMTAQQTLRGYISDWANPVSFTVLFEPVIASVEVSNDGKPTFSGSGGFAGATLEIWISNGAYLTGKTLIANGDWALAHNIAMHPGEYTITARQQVGGYYSDWAIVKDFIVKPPQPIITSVDVSADMKATIVGTGGYVGATLEIWISNGAYLTGKTLMAHGDWAITHNTALPVGKYTITAKQQVGGYYSEWAMDKDFIVKPPKPSITSVDVSADMKTTIVGTGGYVGATLEIWISNGGYLTGKTLMAHGDWAITHNTALPVGKYTITAKQQVGGYYSDWAMDKDFILNPPKPMITKPLPDTTHLANVMVEGSRVGEATVTVQDAAGNVLNGTMTYSGNVWQFEYTWAPGRKNLKALQSLNGQTSDATAVVEFFIKPFQPVIEPPPIPSAPREALKVSGIASGTVTLRMLDEKNQPVEGGFSGTATTRIFTPKADWAPGITKVKVVQTVDGVDSDASAWVSVTAKPTAPSIAPPPVPAAAREALTISGVWSGTVTLQMLDEKNQPVEGGFSGDGTARTFTPKADWAAGDNTVKVVQTVSGIDSDPSDECRFFVVLEDQPDAPRFNLPVTGTITSSRPTIKVTGHPDALITVRLEEAETLHEAHADADGILQFVVATSLVPGLTSLEVKQLHSGLESNWSAPHLFTVRAAEVPKTPVIRTPTEGSGTSQSFRITGTGTTGGTIHLRHTDESMIDIIDGMSNWTWSPKEPWGTATYTVEAQQELDGEYSEWTSPRSFTVYDLRYSINDAGPVLGNPVVGSGQSVLLRVQVASGETGVLVEGVEVEWRLQPEQTLLATTSTGRDGWARYLYTPATVETHQVMADITDANDGIAMTHLYEVTALSRDAWAQQAGLYLDDKPVDLADGDLVLLGGGDKAYKLELRVNGGSVLIGSTVTLHNPWGVAKGELGFSPALGAPQVIDDARSVHWYIFANEDSSGFFGLNLTSPVLPDWQLPGRVEAGDFAEALEVDFDGFAQILGGDPAYPCLGATHVIGVRPMRHSPLLGAEMVLALSPQAAALGVTVSPSTPQTLGENGLNWTLNCANSTQAGDFAVWLKGQALDFQSLALPMSLGHNKVKIIEKYGPTQSGGLGRYGIRAASTFTDRPAVDVSVTVLFPHGQPTPRKTDEKGWLYVQYDGDIPTLTIVNRYDGSIVKP
ncbi:MSCRAMM family protein [Pseudomonas sp.]|uniref:MSCRAMM family protein n=1 Tax=Pseudomonas sp. TaxID=306 RepID=UPI003BB4ED56